MNIIRAIILYNKFNKAYKSSKKLIDSKQGLAEETREIVGDIRKSAQKLVKLLPDYTDVYLDVEEIVKDVF